MKKRILSVFITIIISSGFILTDTTVAAQSVDKYIDHPNYIEATYQQVEKIQQSGEPFIAFFYSSTCSLCTWWKESVYPEWLDRDTTVYGVNLNQTGSTALIKFINDNLQKHKPDYDWATPYTIISVDEEEYEVFANLFPAGTAGSGIYLDNDSIAAANEYFDLHFSRIEDRVADVTQTQLPVKASVNTNNFMLYNYAGVSPISQFIDNNGNIGFAYDNNDNVYIEKINDKNQRTETLTIAKKYPLLGAVTCDDDGSYYIVWGQRDTAGNGGVETIAVSKYDNDGSFVKTAAIKSSGGNGIGYSETRVPFYAGNCAVAIHENTLVSSYARQMYNGHQSNAVIAVNTTDMSLRTDINAYTSHSFDQRVIYHKGYDSFIFADHGDAYPRGFKVQSSKGGSITPFSFYVEPHHWDDMSLLNITNAHLGGIGEVSTGLALAASSAKSYSPEFMTEKKQLFIQIFNPVTGKFITSGERYDEDGKVVDSGVKWLTSYSNASAENPQMTVTDDDKIIIMWEKFNQRNEYECSYFMILSSSGKILQEAVPIGIRLNAFEEPHFIDNHVYWITANGTTATINKMSLIPILANPPSKPEDIKAIPGDRKITLSWSVPKDTGGVVITGYQVSNDGGATWVTPSNGLEHTFVYLRNGTEYTFAVRALNAAGHGPEATITAKPYTTPGAPWVYSATAGNSQVTIYWREPFNNGGDDITCYQVSIDDESEWITVEDDNEYTFTGLTNGTTYEFFVRAVNAAGYGESDSITGTPVAVPTEPLNLTAKSANQQITVSWSAPADDGDSRITEYNISINGGSYWSVLSANDFEYTYYWLTNGTEYTIMVRAVNANGSGAWATVKATPYDIDHYPPANHDDVRQFVSRIYEIALNRNPDGDPGFDEWVQRLISGEVSGIDAAARFFLSEEFQNRGINDADFVELMYEVMLGRPPESPEVKEYWVNKLSQGAPRAVLILGFSASEEFEALCRAAGIQNVPGGSEEALTRGFVARLYYMCLNREPEPDGLYSHTISLLYGRKSGRQVATDFVLGEELTNSNPTDAAFVQICYAAILGRDCTADEVAVWSERINTPDPVTGEGGSRENVFTGFVNSAEFRELCNSYGITP